LWFAEFITGGVVMRKECPSCAVEIRGDAERCPICGYEFPRSRLPLRITAFILLLLFLWPLLHMVRHFFR